MAGLKEVLVSSNSVIGWVGELLAFEELLSSQNFHCKGGRALGLGGSVTSYIIACRCRWVIGKLPGGLGEIFP